MSSTVNGWLSREFVNGNSFHSAFHVIRHGVSAPLDVTEGERMHRPRGPVIGNKKRDLRILKIEGKNTAHPISD